MKHSFVSTSVKQNLFVSVIVHKCLMMLNNVEYTTFKMFVTQMSNYLFVISFQLMFYKTLCYHLARAFTSIPSVKLYEVRQVKILFESASVTNCTFSEQLQNTNAPLINLTVLTGLGWPISLHLFYQQHFSSNVKA